MRFSTSTLVFLLYALPGMLADAAPELDGRALKVSHDGRCGGNSGQTCKGNPLGACCSRWGYCGSSAAYCGTGCQTQFGTCKSTDGHCGKNWKSCLGSGFGDCCNKDGKCGKGSAFCGNGCQSAHGKCDPPAPVKPSTKKPSLTQHSTTSSKKPSTTSTKKASTTSTKKSSTSTKKPSTSTTKPCTTSTKKLSISSTKPRTTSSKKLSTSSGRISTTPANYQTPSTKSSSTASIRSSSATRSSPSLSSFAGSSTLISASPSGSISVSGPISSSSVDAGSYTSSGDSSSPLPSGSTSSSGTPDVSTPVSSAVASSSVQSSPTDSEVPGVTSSVETTPTDSGVPGLSSSVQSTPTDSDLPDVSPSATPTDSPTDSSLPEVTPSPTPDPTPTDPNDESWLSTYTYYEAELPTFEAVYDVPDWGISPDDPVVTCPTQPQDSSWKFELLDNRAYPIVANGNRVGLPATPPGNDTVYPAYHFEQPPNAPDGFYDLVFEDPAGPKYVARASDGSVLFVDESTNGQVPPAGKDYITTIFDVDCGGKLAMATTTTNYVWQLDGNFTTAQAGDGDSTIILLPKSAAGSYKRKRGQGFEALAPKSIYRRNQYTEGGQPRCPNTPPGLVAMVKPKSEGGRDPQSNGCGSAGIGGYIVPDYKFTSCCDTHDLCYDDCIDGVWEQCNSNFGRCMHDQCNGIPWWQPWDRWACPKVADFYAWFVSSTSFGHDAFASANRERCECNCPNGNPATNLAFDSSNCGGCGNQCPAHTHCSYSRCVCDQDTCGNLCVDMQTHPKNCGACGNVCATGICHNGACYTPKSVEITKKCPADFVFNSWDHSYYFSDSLHSFPPMRRLSSGAADSHDFTASRDDPSGAFAQTNHGNDKSKQDCCDICFSTSNCIAFYMEDVPPTDPDAVAGSYCWTVNQQKPDNGWVTGNLSSVDPAVCTYGGFLVIAEPSGQGRFSGGNMEVGPCGVNACTYSEQACVVADELEELSP